MTTAAPSIPQLSSTTAARTWPLWAVAFASTSVVVGVIWDISWHRTIGRDTFWTPAHMAIYVGGIVAGLSCGWLVLRTTFGGSDADRAAAVRYWNRFYGPLGAWVCIWGSFAMIVSGPFDDWWHNAYGLDVEILSPPHAVLALGIITIQIGAMLMVLARQNNARAGGEDRASTYLFTYTAGLVVLMVAVLGTEYIGFPNRWHQGGFYRVAAGAFPLLLVATARASHHRWGATLAAGTYMGLTMLMIWILQLFPAQPLLGPILNPVDHMVAPPFPLILLVPALAIDLLLRRPDPPPTGARAWKLSAATGVAFLGLLLIVSWAAAAFLLSPAARNFVFAADQWDYNARLGDWRYEYWGQAATVPSLLISAAVATVSARVGLWWGGWMSAVRR